MEIAIIANIGGDAYSGRLASIFVIANIIGPSLIGDEPSPCFPIGAYAKKSGKLRTGAAEGIRLASADFGLKIGLAFGPVPALNKAVILYTGKVPILSPIALGIEAYGVFCGWRIVQMKR